MADMATSRAGQDGVVATADGPRAGRPRRRAFTAEYKMRILAQYEQLEDPHERGALLRREGLYTSHISEWRKARDKGAAGVLAEKPAGRPGRSAAEAENEQLRTENEKLAASAARARFTALVVRQLPPASCSPRLRQSFVRVASVLILPRALTCVGLRTCVRSAQSLNVASSPRPGIVPSPAFGAPAAVPVTVGLRCSRPSAAGVDAGGSGLIRRPAGRSRR